MILSASASSPSSSSTSLRLAGPCSDRRRGTTRLGLEMKDGVERAEVSAAMGETREGMEDKVSASSINEVGGAARGAASVTVASFSESEEQGFSLRDDLMEGMAGRTQEVGEDEEEVETIGVS